MIGLGGNSTLGIGVLIQLKDNFTSPSQRVNNAMEKMHAQAQRIMRANLRDVGNLGLGMMAAGGALTLGLGSAVNSAARFQTTMTKVKALGDLDKPQAKVLDSLAKDLAQKYGIMPNEIAGGVLELVKRGVGDKDISKSMNALIMTAIGADEKLEGKGGVAARMMDMVQAWGYRASDMSKIGDILAKGAMMTSMDFLDMAESMRYTQDVLKQLNFSFEESVAMIGILSNAGIKGSMAGTALNNMFTQFTIAITGASKKKNSALAAMGLAPSDFIKANGDMLNLIPSLKKIELALKPFGGVAKQALLNDIFGIRGKRGDNPLQDAIRDALEIDMGNVDPKNIKMDKFGNQFIIDPKTGERRLGITLSELLSQLQHSDGTNQKIFDQISKTFEFRRKKFASTWDTFKINVGNALLPALTAFLKVLTPMIGLITRFADTTLGKAFIAVVASGGLVTLLFGGFLFAISKIGLGFLGWKSTLDQIKMTMGWVMAGGRGRMLATMPGQGINTAGSVYDKNGMLIRNASMANVGMTAASYGRGAGRMSPNSSPSGIFVTPTAAARQTAGRAATAAARQRAAMGMTSKMAATGRTAGVLGGVLGGLGATIGRVGSLFLRLIPVLGWILTAWSIYAALSGDDDEEMEGGVKRVPVPNGYTNEQAEAFRLGPAYIPPSPGRGDQNFYVPPNGNNNAAVPNVNVNVHPGQLNVYTDGEKTYQEKMRWEAEQSAANEGFNQ